jgi:D-inositol-3-phosphate glycosyltransferase
LPSLPRATLAMYGRGGEAERARLAALAVELGIEHRVTFGSLDPQEVGAAYRAADCVVFPSEWPEPFGLVPLEAMECETPVIATGTGGSADFLDDRVNCLLFEPGNPTSLATAVEEMAADDVLRSKLRAQGRATAKSYDVAHMADAYEHRFLVAMQQARDMAP